MFRYVMTPFALPPVSPSAFDEKIPCVQRQKRKFLKPRRKLRIQRRERETKRREEGKREREETL